MIERNWLGALLGADLESVLNPTDFPGLKTFAATTIAPQ